MTLKTKIIFDFCKGELLFEELPGNIKEDLCRKGLVTKNGNLTEKGLGLKNAVLDVSVY
jgi:hypothetical protein